MYKIRFIINYFYTGGGVSIQSLAHQWILCSEWVPVVLENSVYAVYISVYSSVCLSCTAASRARLTMVNTMSKMRGQVKSPGYPQAEGLLGECMLKYGRDMGEDTNFGGALVEMGEAMKRLAEVKDSLDIDVKQNFIDPFQTIVDKDLKDIQHHLKKLEGRRLDYDYKKKRQGKIPDEELKLAAEKFEESKEVAETSMQNLLDTDVEQVSQLTALVESQLQFHRQSVEVLEELAKSMRERVNKAQSQPRQKRMPASRPSFDCLEPEDSNGGWSPSAAPSSSPSTGEAYPVYLYKASRSSSPKNTNFLKVYSLSGHPKCRFVSSSEQIWKNFALHNLLPNGSSAVNGCRQNESPNS
uniref:SH3-domain GRB2-like 1a n=1 Tax=Cyprinus carpio TaxID=7962 RepID=A0A8C2G1W1_CYPCA